MINSIEFKDVNKSYGDFAIKNLNFVLPKGCIMGLVGENGAGKSTTIKLLMNTIKADSGEIKVLGKDVTKDDFVNTKQDIGIVLDEANFLFGMNAKNVNIMMKNTYTNWDQQQYFSYLNRFSLPLNKQIKDYSRGMKMKLLTAIALSHNAKLLILDEATGGLDPIVRDEILDIYNDFTRNPENSILISSHIVSDLEKICDYIAFIHNGKLVLCEEKDSLKEKYAIVRLPDNELNKINPNYIVGKKKNDYFTEALVERDKIPTDIQLQNATIEEIILFIVKGGKN